MAYKTLVGSAVAVWFLCSLFSGAQAASVEALYNEINKLPTAQWQKQLEDGARILGATGRIPARKGAKSSYEELSNLEEKGVPLLPITAEQTEQTEQVNKAMEQIMKELLVTR